jgi:uncharacterized protein (TIGR04255 family)
MRPKTLTNKPLIEAVLELKWKPSLSKQANGVDGDLRLFLGRFHDLVAKEYPAFEVLGAAAVPEQMTPNIAQYRFRNTENGWPLVQLGSGLLTLNDTAGYNWNDFRERALMIADMLFHTYPSKLEMTAMELHYINAAYGDFDKQDVVSFLKDKFRIGFSLPQELFEGTEVGKTPDQFGLQAAFSSQSPRGSLRLSVGKGKANDRDAIVWTTVVHTSEEQLPRMPEEFPKWLESAHDLAEDWFFKLIDGELLKKFM